MAHHPARIPVALIALVAVASLALPSCTSAPPRATACSPRLIILLGGPDNIPGPVRSPEALLKVALKSELSVDLQGEPFADAILLLSRRLQVPIVPDDPWWKEYYSLGSVSPPDIESLTLRQPQRVSLKTPRIAVPDLLKNLCDQVGLSYVVCTSHIFVTSKQKALALLQQRDFLTDPGAQYRLDQVLDSVTSPDESDDVPLHYFAEYLSKLKKINVIEGRPHLIPYMGGVKLREALDHIAPLIRLHCVTRDGILYIFVTQAELDTFDESVVAVPNHTWPVYPTEWDKSKEQYPRWLYIPIKPGSNEMEKGSYDWEMREVDLYRALVEKTVSFDFIAVSFDDIVSWLRNQTKASITVNGNVKERRQGLDVTLRLNNVPLKTALACICRQAHLAYTIHDGSIYISTPEDIISLTLSQTVFYDPAQWKALEAVMNQSVNFNLSAVEFPKAISLLRDQTHARITIDVPDMPQRKIKTVSLIVRDMKLKYALAWLCSQLDLAYTVRDGQIIISTPGRLAADAPR